MCYDIQTKRPASVIRTDHPLSSVDFYSDGATLALGTTNGKILIYDLRYELNLIKPLYALEA